MTQYDYPYKESKYDRDCIIKKKFTGVKSR